MTQTRKQPGSLARRVPAYSRFIVAIPVLGLFAGALTLTVMAGVQTAVTIGHVVAGELAKAEAVLEFIELADAFLLATVLYIMALGLYELFIDDNIPLPAWLEIHSLDDLKKKLVGVVAVVLAVTFLGSVIKGLDPQSLMYEGVGIGAVVAAMGYFLKGDGHA
ncbi:MAG: YqhA family protein [Coriobacteriia bacterium]|nr:YqhA family protein [Coriobacteriia bacterium]